MNKMQIQPCGSEYMYCDGQCVYCQYYLSSNKINTTNTTVKKYETQTAHSITQMSTALTI